MSTAYKLEPRDGAIPFQEASIDIWDKKYRLTAKDGSAIDQSMDDTYRRVAVALAEVEPWVGRLAPTLALDSATDVYRHAAKALGVKNADKLHADALFPIIQAQPKPGEQKQASRPMAQDSSNYGEAVKLAPGLEHITVGA